MDESSSSTNKKRKPNWTEDEMQILSSSIRENEEILFGKFSSSITAEKKKAVWENITKLINAASITCCRREVDEVKKKWKDARTNVKKKEAMRKKQSTTTEGGPPPEVYFKPWELDVLAMIPEELIHGIEGGVDTGRVHETASLSAKSLDPQLSFVVTEVELPDENANAGVPENVHEEKKNTEATMKRRRTGKKGREDLYQQGSEMDELIQINRFRASIEERRLEIEERKAGALERIASALEKKNR